MSRTFQAPTGKTLQPGQIVPEQSPTEPPKPEKVIDLREGAAKVQAEKTAKAEETQEVEMRHCPNCGADLYNYVERPVTEEEKQRWLRYVLGEGRFTKQFKLFNGQVKVVLRSRTLAESDAVFAQLKAEVDDSERPVDPGQYVFRMQSLFLACCLQRIEGRSGGQPGGESYPELDSYDDKDQSKVVQMYDKVIKPMDEPFVGVLIKCLSDFDNLMTVMMNHSDDADFWSPVGEDT